LEPATVNAHLPGGTFTAALGRYSSRVVQTGGDNSGMGRWSFIELAGKADRRLIILNGYHVGPQQYVLGSSTTFSQQYRILQRLGHPDPDPRQDFITAVTNQVKEWLSQSAEVLVCMDANEDTSHTEPDKDIGLLLSTTGLIDLHRFRFPGLPTPATHNRGSRTIDVCLGTKLFAQALTGAWYMPFGIPITLKGDHRTLGLEFDHHILFGNKIPPIPSLQQRGVYSNAYPTVCSFNDRVAEACHQSDLYRRVNDLLNVASFTPFHHQALEQIDQELTKILVSTDKTYRKSRDLPWSPKLHQAFLQHRYWTIKLSAHRTEKDMSQALAKITEQLTEPLLCGPSIAANLRQARKNLREMRRQAAAL